MSALGGRVVEVGSTHRAIMVEGLSRTQIVQYAGAAGDFNPIHTDELFATTEAGNPSVMAHGMLTMGMVARALTDYVGDGHLTHFGGRFLRPVWPGDTLVAALEVTGIRLGGDAELVDIGIVATNQSGEEVFVGYATARADS